MSELTHFLRSECMEKWLKKPGHTECLLSVPSSEDELNEYYIEYRGMIVNHGEETEYSFYVYDKAHDYIDAIEVNQFGLATKVLSGKMPPEIADVISECVDITIPNEFIKK